MAQPGGGSAPPPDWLTRREAATPRLRQSLRCLLLLLLGRLLLRHGENHLPSLVESRLGFSRPAPLLLLLLGLLLRHRDSPPSVGLVAHRFAAQLFGKLSPAPLVVEKIDVELRQARN